MFYFKKKLKRLYIRKTREEEEIKISKSQQINNHQLKLASKMKDLQKKALTAQKIQRE